MFKATDLKRRALKPPKKVRGLSGTSGTFPPAPSEDAIQVALLEWLRFAHPKAWARTHHSPNGGARSAVTGARLKAMGVRKGFPDLLLPLPRHGFIGLAIELKAPGGRMTPEQVDWLDHLASVGWMAVCCVGFDAAKRQIEDYLSTPVSATPKRA